MERRCRTRSTINGRYVITGAEWNGPLRTEGIYDMMYGVADRPGGPFTRAKVGVSHAGQGTIFRDGEGRWWTTMFGNDKTGPFRMHMGLVPLRTSEPFAIAPAE